MKERLNERLRVTEGLASVHCHSIFAAQDRKKSILWVSLHYIVINVY